MTMDRSDWRHAAAHTKAFALVAILAVIGGVIGTGFFSRWAAEAKGPDLIARNAEGDVLLAAFRTLYLVPRDGAVQGFAIEDLGLRGPILSLSSDGDRWYIGDDASGMLHRCDIAARRCEPALSPPRGNRIFRRAHRVAFTANRIHLTDSEHHRIRSFDRDGNWISDTRTGPVALCFPNGVIERQGMLYVVDTNNFRIARIDPLDVGHSETFLHVAAGSPVTHANCTDASSRLGERGTPLVNTALDSATTVARHASPPARPDRVWPAAVLNTSTDGWWVVQQKNGMRDGDVVIYDPAGIALTRVSLPPGADPIDLIQLDDSVLISDFTLSRIHHVSLDGQQVAEWSVPGLKDTLDGILAARSRATSLNVLARSAIVLGVLVGIVVVVLELARQRGDGGWPLRNPVLHPEGPPAPLREAIVWIEMDPAKIAHQRRAMWMSWAIPVLFAAGGVVVVSANADVDSRAFTLVATLWLGASLLLFALNAVLVLMIRRNIRSRLGVSEEQLLLDRGNGQVVGSPWAEVRATGLAVLVDRYVIQLRHPLRGWWRPEEQVRTLLLSRIPREGLAGKMPLEFEALRRGNRGYWSIVIAFALMLLVTSNEQWLKESARAFAEYLR